MSFDYIGAKRDGYTDEDITNHLMQRHDFDVSGALQDGYTYTDIAKHLSAKDDAEDSGFFREAIADPLLFAGQGATQLVRMGTQALGADNPVAESLMGVEDFLGSLISAGSRQQQEEIADIFAEAEGKGVGEQVKAGLRALTVAPIDTLARS